MKKQTRETRSSSKAEPRTRFNWGFHDGAQDQRTDHVALWNRGAAARHFDQTYVAGYYAGQDAVKAGASTESSQPAWEAR